MKAQIALLGLVALLGLSAQAVAGMQGIIHFTGRIIEGGCRTSAVATPSVSQSERMVAVAPGVSVQINAVSQACSGQNLPFNAQYRPLVRTSGQPESGLVIVSYL